MAQVFRCYVEKKEGYQVEANHLFHDLTHSLGMSALTGVRVLRRYDVEGVNQETYAQARTTVLSEPQVDSIWDEDFPLTTQSGHCFGVEALPGQYDQRADSCAQCIQMLTGGDRPLVQAATIYLLEGALSEEQIAAIEDYLINPVESRKATMDKPETLVRQYDAPSAVAIIEGFTTLDDQGLTDLVSTYGLAMDLGDLTFLQAYFRDEENRDPTVTELKLVDTYWSDHCRHTTFATHLEDIQIENPKVQEAYEAYLAARVEIYGEEKAAARPQTLMDLATIGAKTLKHRGILKNLDESEEINACSVKIQPEVDGKAQDWLLMFKNETHNHPTEIEPFGGAATCVGGAIRDPLSGRSYVYQAMRVTGCGDVRQPVDETLEGKLPQRKLATTAAAGYSAYGNQIGLATGLVSEIYHDGYIAKHMEVGAVVGAAPAANVIRLTPAAGDKVILLGGRTGRDGIGGATGSSKTHNLESLGTMASEVQKGNPPEERKIQRLFRNPEVTQLIKRCNDFGAGGVSVAIGELADGLSIELDAVRKKYDGLDGTELAISESQERMAVVVSPENVDTFISLADQENLEAYQVATVTEEARMVMHWNGAKIADLSRAFLDTNGATKYAKISVANPEATTPAPLATNLVDLATSLHTAMQRGLGERFDPSIGKASVLMPFGGASQRTPTQAMAAKLPVAPGQTVDTCSVMAWGFNPRHMELSPFDGAYNAVVDSMAKLVATGCDPTAAYLSFQEYFERLRDQPHRWGKPFGALLGALKAQLDLGVGAIGGKDSMSGSFLDLDVPPTLISFAIAPSKADAVLSPEFKSAGNPVYLFLPEEGAAMKDGWMKFHSLCQNGTVQGAWAVGPGGIAEGLMKMSFGNYIGFQCGDDIDHDLFFTAPIGGLIAECAAPVEGAILLGHTTEEGVLMLPKEGTTLAHLLTLCEGTLEEIYPTTAGESGNVEPISWNKPSVAVCKSKIAMPKAVIPVFPGTNCEYDTAATCVSAGIEPEIVVVRNLTGDHLAQSAAALEKAISTAQMIVLPGGFSGGDEPDGSAKFICSFLRNPRLTDAVHDLLKNRDGLMLGICNGFQALVKLGLVPYGEIRPMDDSCATLTYNTIGRHQSRYVNTRISSVNSPWMLNSQVGDLHAIPVSHGEGRFVAPQTLLETLIANGQVATQYVDSEGTPAMDITVNPNGSHMAIEGIFSPDGRVFGKMGHSERYGDFIAKNIPGNKHQPLFESGAAYFK